MQDSGGNSSSVPLGGPGEKCSRSVLTDHVPTIKFQCLFSASEIMADVSDTSETANLEFVLISLRTLMKFPFTR